ncbi:aldehyde dehydrogenase [Mycena filopes]|nr:aldehyde dehydrogenase [Mycena filopes]
MPTTPISQLQEIHETLRANFQSGVTRPLAWRKHQILQVARMVQDNAEAVAEALAKDLGKPKAEAYIEIGTIVEKCLLSVQRLDEWAKPTAVEAPDWQKAWNPTVHKAPKGTVLIIAPWNFPVILTLGPLFGAIAAGCCAVVKPSEMAPHTADVIANLFPKYLDAGAYRVVLGAAPETTALLELRWDHIFYTGNGRIARIISAAAAKHLTPLTLELGGKSPVIVDPSSFDIDLAAKRILWAKVHNSGQICIAPDYILVPRAHQDALVSAFRRWYAEFFAEGSMRSDSIARIVTPAHHSRLVDLLKRSEGRVVMGGETEEATRKIEPTVLVDVLPGDALMEGEIFGPLLPILAVDSMDEAIDFVRKRDHPLVLYAFTDDPALKERLIAETMSGALVFNDLIQHSGVHDLPFGGVGESGHGSQGLKYTFDAFSYDRASVDIPKESEVFNGVRYPPYTEEKFKAISAAALLPIPSSV